MNLYSIRSIMLLLSVVSILMMLRHFEPSGESWGYWIFASEFYKSGEFVIQGRSPLYILYLQLFNWIDFPFSIYLEWFVTSIITGLSLYLFLKNRIGSWWAVFSVIVWLPFIRYSEPSVQSLALSMTCLAFSIRFNDMYGDLESNSSKFLASYALLIMAYMFRVTYILPLILVLGYDIWRYRLHGLKKIFLSIKDIGKSWHLLVVVIFFFISSLLTLEHPWNNAWFSTLSWFPSDNNHASLKDAGFIQSMNWKYIEYKYGDFTNHDFYFTNKELFGDATTMFAAIMNNYVFVIEQWYRNILDLLKITSGMNVFTHLISVSVPAVGTFIGVIALLYGSFKSTINDNQLFLFLIATILLIGSSAIGIPKARYMVPAIPFFILSIYWYSFKIRELVIPGMLRTRVIYLRVLLFALLLLTLFIVGLLYGKQLVLSGYYISINQKYIGIYDWVMPMIITVYLILFALLAFQFLSRNSSDQREKVKKYMLKVTTPILFLSFAPATLPWIDIAKDVINKPKIMESYGVSFLNSKDRFFNLSQSCNGIMTMEHIILSVMLPSFNGKIYDIWEIPPFGKLHNPVYDNLNPKRVNCLFISDSLSSGPTGKATNQTIRYKNYIYPYELELLNSGAKIYKISGYGKAVILEIE